MADNELLPGFIPADTADERAMLLAYLRRQRELVQWKCDGLSDEAARAVATPTGLTIHGVVRHLENVERWWIRWRFAGQDDLRWDWTDEDPDGELHVPADVRLADLLVAYRTETGACDGVIEAHPLDEIGKRCDNSLRWILFHLLEELSRHLGHLDVLCEQADGRTGEEPRPGIDA